MRTCDDEIAMVEKWHAEAQQKPGSPLARFMSAEMLACIRPRLRDAVNTDILALWHRDRDTLLSRPSLDEVDALRQELQDALKRCNKLEELRAEYEAKYEINRLKALLWDAHEAWEETT